MENVGPGMTGASQSPEPQSLGQLLAMFAKQMLKRLPLMIALGAPVLLFVWVLHTFLLVGPNEGFNASGDGVVGWLLSQILALRGRMASGASFWFVFSALGGATLSKLITRKGAFFGDLARVPQRIVASFAGGNAALASVLAGVGFGVLFVALMQNRLLALVAVGLSLLTLSEGPTGFPALVMRCAYNDGRKLLSKPARRLPAERGEGFITGFAFGCLAYLMMFLIPNFLFVGLGVVMVVGAVVLAGQAGPAAAGTTGIMLAAFFVLLGVRSAFGDDGGWREAGGTFTDWITSEGAALGVAMGLPPAIGSMLGAILGIFGPAVGAEIAAGLMAAPVAPVAPPAPPIPPQYPPEIEWTGPDGVTRVLTYNPEYGGYINNLTGGLVDPANIDGWKQNIADTKAQTDAWREHNAQLEAAGLDAQSQALAKIQADLAAKQAAAAAESAKWKQWFKDYYASQQEHYSKMAKAYNRQADLMGGLETVASGLETGADFGVNVLANVTGPVGKSIKAAYTVTKDVTKNMSAANAQGKSIMAGAGKGLLEAGFDLGFDALKGTKAVQKIPGFGKYQAGDLSGYTTGEIEKAITQQMAKNLGSSFTEQELIRGALKNGIKGAGQSQLHKWLIKDPLKKLVGLK